MSLSGTFATSSSCLSDGEADENDNAENKSDCDSRCTSSSSRLSVSSSEEPVEAPPPQSPPVSNRNVDVSCTLLQATSNGDVPDHSGVVSLKLETTVDFRGKWTASQGGPDVKRLRLRLELDNDKIKIEIETNGNPSSTFAL